jgi:hypothetical protein
VLSATSASFEVTVGWFETADGIRAWLPAMLSTSRRAAPVA